MKRITEIINKKYYIFFLIYIFLELFIFLSTIIFDFLDFPIVYYLAILLNFLFSLMIIEENKKNEKFIVVGLFFTLMADTFLVLINDYYFLSVVIFTMTQIMYFIYLRLNYKYSLSFTYEIVLRLLSIILLEAFFYWYLPDDYDALLAISIFYFTNFFFNVIDSFISIRKNYLFTLGLFLFIICDVFVGINNMGEYIIESSFIKSINNSNINFIWLFYFPSQVFITLSIKYHKKINNI